MNLDYLLTKIITALSIIYLGITTGIVLDYTNGTIQTGKPNKKTEVKKIGYQDLLRLELDMPLYQVEAILGQGTIVSQDSKQLVLKWVSNEGYLVCHFNSDKILVGFVQKYID